MQHQVAAPRGNSETIGCRTRMRAHTSPDVGNLFVCTGPPLRSADDIEALQHLIRVSRPATRHDVVTTIHTLLCSRGGADYPGESAQPAASPVVGRAVRIKTDDNKWWVWLCLSPVLGSTPSLTC